MRGNLVRGLEDWLIYKYGGPGGRAMQQCQCDDVDVMVDNVDVTVDDRDVTVDDVDVMVNDHDVGQ